MYIVKGNSKNDVDLSYCFLRDIETREREITSNKNLIESFK